MAARHGLGELPAEVLNRQFAATWKKLSGFNYARPEWFELVNQSFAGLTQMPLSETLFADLYSHFERAEAWRIFDDVMPTLEALRSGALKLGIISNWDARLRPLLRELKLEQYFHAVVISCEAGMCKPSPAIFNEACKQLGMKPAEILHIGDSTTMDVNGATASGFRALLLDRGGIRRPGTLSTLTDLQSSIPSL